MAFIDLLRFIRISSANPTSFVLSRPGKHVSLTGDTRSVEDDAGMDLDG